MPGAIYLHSTKLRGHLNLTLENVSHGLQPQAIAPWRLLHQHHCTMVAFPNHSKWGLESRLRRVPKPPWPADEVGAHLKHRVDLQVLLGRSSTQRRVRPSTRQLRCWKAHLASLEELQLDGLEGLNTQERFLVERDGSARIALGCLALDAAVQSAFNLAPRRRLPSTSGTASIKDAAAWHRLRTTENQSTT